MSKKETKQKSTSTKPKKEFVYNVVYGDTFLREIKSASEYKWTKEKAEALRFSKEEAEKVSSISELFKTKKA